MDQLFDIGSALANGANVSSILAMLKISSGETTLESLFQSLIDGLMNFFKFLFTGEQIQ